MPKLSQDLISLLSNLQFVDVKNDEANFYYIPVKDHTNEFIAEHFLGFPLDFMSKASTLFKELQDILAGKGHLISTDVVICTMIMFTLCPPENRKQEDIELFFELVSPRKLKQYLFLEVKATEPIFQLKFFDYSRG